MKRSSFINLSCAAFFFILRAHSHGHATPSTTLTQRLSKELTCDQEDESLF
jgi:hypothetical protein